MKKKLIVIGFMMAFALTSIMGCASGDALLSQISGGDKALTTSSTACSSQAEGIWVAGQGKVTVTPDIAVLSLGIEAQATTVAEARTQAAEAMEEVMTALKDSGIAKEDIQTYRFSIYPIRKWDREREEEIQVGYRVTNLVNAKIRELDEAGSVIDAVAKAGGDLTRIQGISFTVEDPTPYYNQAREKAMDDANAKAKQLARLGGVTLGKVTYISESTGFFPPTPRAMFEMEAAASSAPPTPISPGEQEISLTVQVVYAIE